MRYDIVDLLAAKTLMKPINPIHCIHIGSMLFSAYRHHYYGHRYRSYHPYRTYGHGGYYRGYYGHGGSEFNTYSFGQWG